MSRLSCCRVLKLSSDSSGTVVSLLRTFFRFGLGLGSTFGPGTVKWYGSGLLGVTVVVCFFSASFSFQFSVAIVATAPAINAWACLRSGVFFSSVPILLLRLARVASLSSSSLFLALPSALLLSLSSSSSSLFALSS